MVNHYKWKKVIANLLKIVLFCNKFLAMWESKRKFDEKHFVKSSYNSPAARASA